jgi:CDP-diglyceride synthetase
LHHRSTRNLSGGFEWGSFFPGVLAFAFASGEGQKSLTQRVRVLVEFRSRALWVKLLFYFTTTHHLLSLIQSLLRSVLKRQLQIKKEEG